MNVRLHHRSIDPQLRAVLQPKINRCLHDNFVDGLKRVGRQPIEVAVERMVFGHTLPMELRELAQRHSIGDALAQLAVVPVLNALENERAQNLLRRQSAATALWIFQSSREIAPHLLDNLPLIIKKVGNDLEQRLQADAPPYQFPIRKTDLLCRGSRHLSALACGLVLLTLQRLHVTWSRLKQQLLQGTTPVQAVLEFRHQVRGNVNGKTPPLRSTVQDPTGMLLARLAGLTGRADARSAPQAERAENCRESVGRLALEPVPDISR